MLLSHISHFSSHAHLLTVNFILSSHHWQESMLNLSLIYNSLMTSYYSHLWRMLLSITDHYVVGLNIKRLQKWMLNSPYPSIYHNFSASLLLVSYLCILSMNLMYKNSTITSNLLSPLLKILHYLCTFRSMGKAMSVPCFY